MSRLEVGRQANRAGQDAVAETGGEPFDLGLDPIRDVERGAIGDVDVGPTRVLTRRRTARVEAAGLDDDHERSLWVTAAGDLGLGRGDLGQGSTDMDRSGAIGTFGAPGNRPVERPVNLDDAQGRSGSH